MGIIDSVNHAFTFEYTTQGFAAEQSSYDYQCEAFESCYSKFNMHSSDVDIPIQTYFLLK